MSWEFSWSRSTEIIMGASADSSMIGSYPMAGLSSLLLNISAVSATSVFSSTSYLICIKDICSSSKRCLIASASRALALFATSLLNWVSLCWSARWIALVSLCSALRIMACYLVRGGATSTSCTFTTPKLPLKSSIWGISKVLWISFDTTRVRRGSVSLIHGCSTLEKPREQVIGTILLSF